MRDRDGAAVADIRISKLEAGPPVVLVLRHHAVEPDHSCASVRDGRAPKAKSYATAQILPHDVEAKATRTVIDAGDGRGRGAVELADEEAFRIGRGEAGVVGEARIPAWLLPSSPAIEISSAHRPMLKSLSRATGDGLMDRITASES
jgi:hypothetical protein